MSHNWNVYKVFNNGRRAKAPVYNFMYGNESNVVDHFEDNIKEVLVEKFGSKIKENKFSILRADLPQIRQTEETLEESNKKLRSKVFAKNLKNNDWGDKRIECVLLFSGATEWKWQWCVVQAGTTNVLKYVSPKTDSYEGAHAWMNDQIKQL